MPFGVDARGRLAVLPAFALVIPFRCSVAPMRGAAAVVPEPRPRPADPAPPSPAPQRDAAPVASAATPKQEQPAPRIASVPPPEPPARAVTLPDAVVVKALDAGQQAFLRCWARAQRSDSPPSESKVRLHLEVDEDGRVTAARSDSDSPALERCLVVVSRQLAFPPPGQPAVVELPLMFR